jgi:hypothetical protein
VKWGRMEKRKWRKGNGERNCGRYVREKKKQRKFEQKIYSFKYNSTIGILMVSGEFTIWDGISFI